MSKGVFMAEEEKSMSVLAQKIYELVEKYKALLAENETLRQEIVKVKALNEAQAIQIAKLEKDVINKNVNADDLLSKIEAVLGK